MKLTIITINYNNVIGLQKTIDSILSQTFKYHEWIVIDGGSTDGSKELILNFQHHFSYWCSEPDQGIYNAMNKGVRKATGDYLLFLNSGDVLYDNRVLEEVHQLDFKQDILSGQMVRMDNGQLLRKYNPDIFLQLFTNTINHQATFIRRELLVQYPYDESLRIVSDWKFWLEAIVIHKCSFEVTDLMISKQDMTGISYSEKYRTIHQAERKKVLSEFFPPAVLKTLQDYSTLRARSIIRNLSYLKECHPRLYVYVKKIVSFVSLASHKLFND